MWSWLVKTPDINLDLSNSVIVHSRLKMMI
jgi:hypothetical protein